MKRFIMTGMAYFFFLNTWAQDARVRVAEVQFHTQSQNSINLTGTLGEGLVGSELKGGTVIVHGLYSGVMPDSMTAVNTFEPITGLKAFPNPTRDGVILASDVRGNSVYRVSLMAEDGVLFKEWTWQPDDKQLKMEIDQTPVGMYFIIVKDVVADRQSVVKVIRQ